MPRAAEERTVNRIEPVTRVLLLIVVQSIAASTAFGCLSPTSPLVLDLDGNGIGTSNVLTSPVSFDLNGDGIPERVGWTSQYDPDGFLWLDRNGNGRVDSGRELFGNATELSNGTTAPNGFVALAEYDDAGLGGNGDGEVTSADWIYPFLRVWTDLNHDGQLDAGESHTLAELKVAVISLQYDRSDRIDGCMNRHQFRSRFITRSSTRSISREVQDIFFQTTE